MTEQNKEATHLAAPDHEHKTTSNQADPWILFAAPGWGSAIVEAALTIARVPFERVLVDPSVPGPERDRLVAANPLAQIPTAILPDGSPLTESAAMIFLANDRAPESGLVPPADAPERAPFLRWLVFLVAAVYPTFTYGDDPKKWVKTAPDELRASTDAHRKAMFQDLERIAGSPYFLGDRFTALDLYVAVMTRWRPRRAWFEEACPKLTAIARRIDAHPELAPVWSRNFPG